MPAAPTAATLFAPVFALVAWTFCIVLLTAFRRLRAGFDGSVSPREYVMGESSKVPPAVSLPNRNSMNLMELPLLFYLAVLLAHLTATATPLLVGLAWVYVALRIVHSLIHITYNRVFHRFVSFASSTFVLIVIWMLLARSVLFA